MWGTVPLADAVVPIGEDADPADFTDPTAFARVWFGADDEPTVGAVGWEGQQITEEAHSASAFYTLEW